jgi:hypothetical protein
MSLTGPNRPRITGRGRQLYPALQTSIFSAMSSASSTFRSAVGRVTAGPLASSCATVDQGRLRPAHRMCGQLHWVKTDAGNSPLPLGARIAASSEIDLSCLGPGTEPAPACDRCCANTRRATAASARSIRSAPADRFSCEVARLLRSREAPHHRRSNATRSHPRNLLSIARLKSAKSRTCSSRCNLARMDQTCPGRSGGLGPIILPLVPW